MFSNNFGVFGMIAICSILAGCMDDQKLASIATELKRNAPLRAKLVQDCIDSRHIWSAQSQEGLATIVTTADSRNKRLICERLYNSIASGRLKAKDLHSFGGEVLTPNAIKILRGQ